MFSKKEDAEETHELDKINLPPKKKHRKLRKKGHKKHHLKKKLKMY